jgi:type II secretory pathway pseudopilin PulG
MKTLERVCGFSLVETVVALGLFAFCILGVLALIPVGMGAARSVAEENSAAALADAFFGAWLVAPTNSTVFLIPPMFTDPAVPVNGSSTGTMYFRDDAEQVSDATQASLQMDYTVAQQTGGFGIDLVFQWPPGQTNAATQIRRFQQFVAR